MKRPGQGEAFGAPGIEPRWSSSAKEGLGTAYHSSCRLWFTLSHGIVNEIYYPHVDQPNTRDLQFLVTDGESFCHEEKRDLLHQIEFPVRDTPFYRLINSDPQGRYRLVKQVMADPCRSVLVVHTKLEITDPSLKGKLRLYALLAPHMARNGGGNAGSCAEIGGFKLLRAQRADAHLAMGCSAGFSRRSVGYVGFSDGWQDLMKHRRMEWEFRSAACGNIALTGEIDLGERDEFTLSVALGSSAISTGAKLLQSMAEPFEAQRDAYVRQWRASAAGPLPDFSAQSGDGGHLCRVSRFVLLAHEDKDFAGAMVASMSIPWGETKDDSDQGGYHLVWTRDLVQSASALLASGQTVTPLRALIWLATVQRLDGSFPQNSWINGKAYWHGLQLDEIAAPILLAWRLAREGVDLSQFDPGVLVLRAASYLIRQGPVSAQERWEEVSGYSPSTLATVIAGLVCAADFMTRRSLDGTAAFILDYADWLSSHLEEWTVTDRGELVPGLPRHYVRVTPSDVQAPDPHADPDRALLSIANGGGTHPARNVVGGDFLHLVRLGIRAAGDPVVVDSVKVIDQVLKRDIPQGPAWARYNHDGYGQKEDGSAYDGTGVGRAWPILTGERGHYELAAGRDPNAYILAIERFANQGGMLSEQLWDAPDLPEKELWRGGPSGAAMPLCWSHAEYLSLLRSAHDGVCFDRVEPAYQRYVAHPVKASFEMWSARHPIRRLAAGRSLRLILAGDAVVIWTCDGWSSIRQGRTALMPELGLWSVDLPVKGCAPGTELSFTFHWQADLRWEGKNMGVLVV